MSGIYFLVYKKRIVYIGQTTNLSQRLIGHANKKFDHVRFIECEKSVLNYYEARWIKKFCPKYNGVLGRPKSDKKIAINFKLRESILNKVHESASIEKRSFCDIIEIAVEEKYL